MTMYSADTPLDESSSSFISQFTAPAEATDDTAPDWLGMARDAYESSTDYFDSSIRKGMEDSIAHFQNRHAAGSKYHSEAYKYRAKGFRPKTRAIVRQNEAAAAVALFSTQDVLHITPEDEGNQQQRISAEILQELVQYRLDHSVNWYQTALGAYQDALVTGVCISHQYWDYEQISEPTDGGIHPITGEQQIVWQNQVVIDRPRIELRPVENIRFAPSADWTDPIGSSPYVIDRFPMHIGDIKRRMTERDAPASWYELDDGAIMTAMTDDDTSVRAAREHKREDSKDPHHALKDFDTAWIHRNIIRLHGDDYLYYTLGVHHLLSDPVPLHTVYKHLNRGERPYVMGKIILETHKVYPAGLVDLLAPLQREANDLNNQRRDNVSLVLNRRYIARRGATIDYKSLTRNVPGSITLVDDIQSDIRVEAPPDVTASGYQEQDRLNMDYDELAGAFSQSSVGSNRKLNETVGGMQMLQSGANQIVEYQIRTFSETWVEPVLRQLVKLEQCFETSEPILKMIGSKIRALQRFGVDQITDQMLAGEMTVRVNVGFNSTDPKQRVDKLAMGLNTIGQFAPQMIQGMDTKELVTEVLGALGYRSVERFFPSIAKGNEGQPDPQIQQLQQQLQELQQQLQTKQVEIQGRLQQEQIKSQTTLQKAQLEAQAKVAASQQDSDTRLRLEQMRGESVIYEAQIRKAQALELEALRNRLGVADKRLEAERNAIERGKLQSQRDALAFQIALKQKEMASQLRDNQADIVNSNPNNDLAQTIMNDRYNLIPDSVG